MKLTSLPNFISITSYIQTVTELDLSKNRLFDASVLFEALSQMGQLQHLNVSENYLNGCLSVCPIQLSRLETLILDSNQFNGLSDNVSNWTNLRIFSIACNSLTSIPIACSSWTSIEQVNFRNNKITEIPGEIFNSWLELKKIYMSYNLLKKIPEEIGSCIKLIEADFSKYASLHCYIFVRLLI